MTEQWYLRRENGTVEGPFLEREVAVQLLSGEIGASERVKQGLHGQWCDAARARAVFQQLSEVGWYIRTSEGTYGPFTEAKLLDLHRTDEVAVGAELRKGLEDDWKSADSVLSLWQQQKVPDIPDRLSPDAVPASTVSRQWSVEPIRHVVMAIVGATSEVDQCQPFERLLLGLPSTLPNSIEDEYRLVVKRTNGQVLGELNEQNSRLIAANAERGLVHLTLLCSRPGADNSEIALVLCPPGIDGEACRTYVSENVRPAG